MLAPSLFIILIVLQVYIIIIWGESGDLVVSVLESRSQSGFEHWLGTLCCVLGKMLKFLLMSRISTDKLLPGLNASIVYLLLHVWQGYLTLSYFFTFDRIMCVLVTFLPMTTLCDTYHEEFESH